MSDSENAICRRLSRTRVAVFLLCASTAVLSVSCTQSATVRLQDGSTVEGRIVDNDKGTLVIAEFDDRIRRVDTKRVEDIDHPGDTAVAIGGVLAVGGALLSVSLLPADHDGLRTMVGETLAAGVALVTIPAGLGLFIWGDWTNSASKERAEPKRAAPIAPDAVGGLAVTGEF